MKPLPDPDETAEVSVHDTAAWLAETDGPLVIDCREDEELAICSIPGARHIPLGKFPQSAGALHEESHCGIVILCHHGMRSISAAMFLRERGIHRVFSMAGGIDAWSREVDPCVPRY